MDRYWIFQTGKIGDQTQNPAIFDHVNLKKMYVMLNSSRYPAVYYNLSFANQQFSGAYGDATLFGIRYFGIDELITRSNISPADYKTLGTPHSIRLGSTGKLSRSNTPRNRGISSFLTASNISKLCFVRYYKSFHRYHF